MLKAMLAAISTLLVVFAVQFENVFIFNDSGGEIEFYLSSAGSDCTIESLSGVERDPIKILSIKGGAVKKIEKKYIDDLLKRTNARHILSERVGNVVSNYYYSNKITGYKSINGKKVNIHVCFDGKSYSVGTPIIFGAY